jgi:NAD(P)H-quinone oxidoreductase subunit 5
MIESIHEYAWCIPLFPSLNALILGVGLLVIRRTCNSQRRIAAWSSIISLIIALGLSLCILNEQITSQVAYSHLWPWLEISDWSLKLGFLVDPLSSIMLVVVTSVAVTVMIYTSGYMEHDQGYVRFFTYLSLFTASMLGLILSPNLVQVYVFWELVGMCSYLLVGFWFNRPTAAYASQKAFITNRIGDLGLLLGILGIYWLTGSLEFNSISECIQKELNTNPISTLWVVLCSFCLFMGPIAKSAQFPLHVWLPDAMEGPTPISALIHAATMVAAGVFLVARLLPLFQQVPIVMDIIAYTGAITAVLGATIALVQTDLKKGLAYSTMSQLGYMILALGVGSYQAGLFHLITHAYSKALLFLGSGSVIHGIEPIVGYHPNKCQNMGYMGGLRNHMPVTTITFLIGTLSLCGIPPLSCFWSKDEILIETWHKFPVLGFFAWLTAGLTAFYMFRIYFLTFEGNFRGASIKDLGIQSNSSLLLFQTFEVNSKKGLKPHESTLSMTFPLILLSIPTIFIGFLGAPLPSGIPNSSLLSYWLHTENLNTLPNTGWSNFIIQALPSTGIAVAGILLAWFFYGPKVTRLYQPRFSLDPLTENWTQSLFSFIYKWSLNRAYIDSLYEIVFIKPMRKLANLFLFVDQWLVDGFVNLFGLVFLLGGEGLRYTETGRITNYIFVFVLGLTFLLLSSLNWPVFT